MQLKRVTILGVGLLGGSIGLALKSAISGCEIVGYGHRSSTLDRAREVGAIDDGTTDPAAAVAGSDLVILCTPVLTFAELLRQIRPSLTPGAIVTDVGSTKRSVVEAAEAILPSNVHFVGSHPMAGSEKRGVEFARTDLFKNAICIVTPTPKTIESAKEHVKNLWKLLGMRVTELSPTAHDQLLADVSHLPHLTAAALVAMQQDRALDLCGKGFLDTTRVAGGDGALWRDIVIDNRDNVRSAILRLRDQFDELLKLMDAEDSEPLRQWLDAAAKRREELVQKKLREMNPE
ncbi:MAG TPA: prephenate dehydrogenase [Tepidisphaeraceae bacterium]|jgi:prephenate dehydrogenase|nr:prephenate dehydrogenase [Tepidisphaeraceae bacterium]